MRRRDQDGAVLLTVLLMVAVMATVAVALMDEIRLAVKRTGNAEISAQAHWYALGAEAFAVQLAARARAAADLGAGADVSKRLGEPLVLPIEGGRMVVTLRDASNCFNLNSLAAVEEEAARELARVQFRQLLRALGLFDADQDRLADSLTDWLDTDTQPLPQGAEDGYYARLSPPTRAANALIGDPAELRGVAGYGDGIYERLRDVVCARPGTERSVLNLNSMGPEDAPLLVMLTGQSLSLDTARVAIQGRPATGYQEADAFWTQPVLAGRNPGEEVRRQTGVEATYYELQATVTLDGREVGLTSLLDLGRGRSPTVVARRFGVPE